MSKFDEVKRILQSKGYEVETTTVNKNNAPRAGIIIKGITASPILYEDAVMNLPNSAEDIVEAFLEALNDAPVFNTNEYQAKDFILKNVTFKVVNKNWNSELLEKSVYDEIKGTDLVATVRVSISDKASFAYTKGFCPELTDEEVIRASYNNLEKHITMSMFPMVCCTNQSGLWGATAILDHKCLDDAMDILGVKKVWVIPSSIHEVLCIPFDNEVFEIMKMIQEVNEACVNKEDRLSDHPYIYDGEKLSTPTLISWELLLEDLF